MPVYHYVASDIDGNTRAGVIEAPSKEEARRTLRNRELYTTTLEEKRRGLLESLIRLFRPSV